MKSVIKTTKKMILVKIIYVPLLNKEVAGGGYLFTILPPRTFYMEGDAPMILQFNPSPAKLSIIKSRFLVPL